jgi:hypothetical protein
MSNILGETDRETVGSSVIISFDDKDKPFAKNIYDALAVDDRNIWVCCILIAAAAAAAAAQYL